MMNLCPTKIKTIFIGIKQQQKEIIQLNLEKKLDPNKKKKFGTVIKKKKNLKLNILE